MAVVRLMLIVSVALVGYSFLGGDYIEGDDDLPSTAMFPTLGLARGVQSRTLTSVSCSCVG